MANPNESNVFIKLKDEDVAKLLYFTKSREKSKLLYEALIYFVANNPSSAKKFANPMFETEFEKAAKKVKEIYKKNCECWDYFNDEEC